ncbi:efflux RND transporter permease subunit [Paenibacillus macquariensis]|uniref:Hydrophobic/amphiphilic exporter-1, HAE1 family n=1 Tax=Paenibacillus macquariensis TaxID=948756 RepID=A0ABY1K9H5_9BACL|nr:efflux RND transporter permease subunit [Paenibacillus macquariensis]MEC0092462.1 efflux RND transporter permease subunit [Paenibacillus macquariensis]OAB35421.1 Swarming motility protein SwrC [Paenibacillus macquariensis subsp. macquariensis]SIR47054.1 hydrophobic/amphiphilic exporter-1, HAE1 family [Paenibacillus macquariensis]
MKSIINFSINNKFAIWLLTIIITAAGLFAGVSMKQETMPNISIPFLNVVAVYPGAAPEGVVQDVTIPLEQRLRNVDGVKTVTSTSMENAASIAMEFDYGTDLDQATAAVREALNEVTLPKDAQKPTISKFSLSSFPVISLSASNNQAKDLEELTKVIENQVKPEIEKLAGVASVSISGQYVKEVQLKFNTSKMAELGLNVDTVKGIVQGSSLRVPLGLFNLEESQKAVVVDGNIVELDDLKNLAIPVIPNTATGAQNAPAGNVNAPTGGAVTGIPTVKLSEIADIQVIGKAESISRTNGLESIGISIVKDNDANTVDVVNAVKDKMADLKKSYSGLELITLLDQGEPIEDSVNTMLSKAVFGALFAVIIILIFLRNIRSTIISIISIPLSLLTAILILWQLDITLNMMTLGAMTVAIGRVIDDSIVVIENIYRRLTDSDEPLRGRELVREATREMFVPIMSSTIVTIAVFLPLAFVSGMVGELFLPFALTMVFALLASLVIAITIVPMLAHTLFKKGINKKRHTGKEEIGGLARGYQRILNWCLSHKAITFGGAILLLVGSLMLYPLIGTSFMPDQKDKYTMVTYSPKPGEQLAAVEKLALKAEEFILKQPGVEKMQYSIGGSNPMGGASASNSGLFYIGFKSDTKNFEDIPKQLVEDLHKLVPEGEWASLDMTGGMGGSGLSVSVFGDSLEDIKPISDEVLKLVKEDTEHFDKAKTSLSTSYDQYTIVADQEKLSSLGLTAGQIAMELSPVRERPVLTEIEVDNKTYKVYIEADSTVYKNIDEISNEKIKSPLGMEVAIKDVAKVEKGTSPNSITRTDGKMVVSISANIVTADVGKASTNLEEKIKSIDKPDGIEIKFGGATEQINDTFTQLGLAMLAAIAVVYFVLVVTFGGGLAPFAILFSLPFTIIGALVGLLIAKEPLNVSSLMGALMLIGIVVTNAIVLIHRVIHKEQEGMSTRDALLEAGATRLRPILMTALATIGALLPLVTGLEDSAGIISRGLGITVIGGLISSTLLTLVIVPVVYEFLMKFRKPKLQD